MYSPCTVVLIAAPLVVGTAIGLNAAEIALLITASILVGGLATLLQTLGLKWFGAKLPIVQGTSFAAVASMIAIRLQLGEISKRFLVL